MREKLKPNLMSSVNIFSYLTFWWMNEFFKFGSKNKLEESDMMELEEKDTSSSVCSVLERAWLKELQQADQKPSLTKAAVKAYGVECCLIGLIGLLKEVLRIGSSVLVYYLILYLEEPSGQQSWHAYAYAASITLLTIVNGFLNHFYYFLSERCGWHLRAAMCAMMYKKTLKLSQKSLSQTPSGHIVNLSATDVLRFDLLPMSLNYIWIVPLQFVAVTAILWQAVGAAVLVGVGFTALLMLMQTTLGRRFGVLRKKTAVITDDRVRIIGEVIMGMRIIKMYAWEKPFAKLVSATRRREIEKILQSSALRAFNTTIYICQEKLASFVTLLAFVAMGGTIVSSKVFLIIGMFGSVLVLSGWFIQYIIEKFYESLVSLKRIERYLLLDEQPMNKIEEHEQSETDSVTFINFSAKWATVNITGHHDETPLALNGLNLKVKNGQLLAVIGRVGAGKSSLLSAVLRELPPHCGNIGVTGKISFADQSPWIFSDTLRANILFGATYEKDWYDEVIDACSLTKDLDRMPGADLALVGERGIALSGGQKARVNLARAAYRKDAEIFLLDDPLSAVDPSVANHIFKHCICGLMANKTRILVTHQLQLLKEADWIVVLEDGTITHQGTYEELQAIGTDFVSLLKWEEFRTTADDSSPKVNNVTASWEPCSNLPEKSSTRASTKSSRSAASIGSMVKNIGAQFEVEEEYREQGSIGAGAYLEYLSTGSNNFVIFATILIASASHVLLVLVDWWLSVWSDKAHQTHYVPNFRNTTNYTLNCCNSTVTTTELQDANAHNGIDNRYFSVVYAVLVVTMFIILLARTMILHFVFVLSGKRMHEKMFKAILRSPIRFFDTNPAGRILNRFSKDMGQVDELLPSVFMEFIHNVGKIVSGVILASIVNYFVVIIVIPLVLYFIWLRRYFLLTSRDIKRLEGTCRSPVFSWLSSTLQGLTTIRAYGMQDKFEEQFHDHQDLHSAAWFLFICAQRWLAVRMEVINALFIGCVAFFSLSATSILHLNPGEIGLILTYLMLLGDAWHWGVRMSAETENVMTSVERIQQYSHLSPEAPDENHFKNPSQPWPKNGVIIFENVSFSYFKDGPTVLKNLSINIRAKEKIGIVGRTGAGKSSIISALFRLSELVHGEIYIDGISISSLSLEYLRGSFSVIPQDPVLFSGTLRRNMDPFSLYTTEEIWDSLDQVHLKSEVESLPGKLETEIAESGSNFSVGQRQLFCLARALLKKSKILVIDEATANVDLRTDQLIQGKIRKKFGNCTVLTIAHRLNTIIDSDRVLVLEAGHLKEFDAPHILLRNANGHFSKMVRSCGILEQQALAEKAREAFEAKGDPSSAKTNQLRASTQMCDCNISKCDENAV